MANEILIYANHEVARRYRRTMDKYGFSSLTPALALGAAGMYLNMHWLFYILPGIFLLMALFAFSSRNSMLKDADERLLVFRFTSNGWYRNESPVLYRWEDFKSVEFQERAINFHEAKQHKIVSCEISPMLMTESEFEKVERWIRQHLPNHMKP